MSEAHRKTSRREFARTMAVLTVTAPLVGATATAAPAPPARSLHRTAVPRREAQWEDPPETGALMRVIRHRYGEDLSAEQLEAVERGVVATLRRAERMREVPLENGQEPRFVFRAYRKEA